MPQHLTIAPLRDLARLAGGDGGWTDAPATPETDSAGNLSSPAPSPETLEVVHGFDLDAQLDAQLNVQRVARNHPVGQRGRPSSASSSEDIAALIKRASEFVESTAAERTSPRSRPAAGASPLSPFAPRPPDRPYVARSRRSFGDESPVTPGIGVAGDGRAELLPRRPSSEPGRARESPGVIATQYLRGGARSATPEARRGRFKAHSTRLAMSQAQVQEQAAKNLATLASRSHRPGSSQSSSPGSPTDPIIQLQENAGRQRPLGDTANGQDTQMFTRMLGDERRRREAVESEARELRQAHEATQQALDSERTKAADVARELAAQTPLVLSERQRRERAESALRVAEEQLQTLKAENLAFPALLQTEAALRKGAEAAADRLSQQITESQSRRSPSAGLAQDHGADMRAMLDRNEALERSTADLRKDGEARERQCTMLTNQLAEASEEMEKWRQKFLAAEAKLAETRHVRETAAEQISSDYDERVIGCVHLALDINLSTDFVPPPIVCR